MPQDSSNTSLNPDDEVELLRARVSQLERALSDILSVMGPRKSPHTMECITCEGCLYEIEEALDIAGNALAGLSTYAHLGPAHTREEWEQHRLDEATCPVCLASPRMTEDERMAAWTAAGLGRHTPQTTTAPPAEPAE